MQLAQSNKENLNILGSRQGCGAPQGRGAQWGHHGKNSQFSNLQIRKNTAVIYKYTIYCAQNNNFIPSDL